MTQRQDAARVWLHKDRIGLRLVPLVSPLADLRVSWVTDKFCGFSWRRGHVRDIVTQDGGPVQNGVSPALPFHSPLVLELTGPIMGQTAFLPRPLLLEACTGHAEPSTEPPLCTL